MRPPEAVPPEEVVAKGKQKTYRGVRQRPWGKCAPAAGYLATCLSDLACPAETQLLQASLLECSTE